MAATAFPTTSHISLACDCGRCPVGTTGVCATAASLRRALSATSRSRRYRTGAVVVRPDEEPTFVGVVVSGVLRIVRTSMDGREQIVGFLVASDIFNHGHARPASFAIEAATDAVVCQFERRSFEALVHDSPELERELMGRTLDELDAAREWITLLGTHGATERVASFLMILCRRIPPAARQERAPQEPFEISVPISRSDIGHYLGLSEETVCRSIHALARAGVIAIRDSRRFEVQSLAGLVAASGESGAADSRAFDRLGRGFAA